MRAVVSAPPAGGYGTITCTGRVGYAGWAAARRMKGAVARPASSVRRESLVLGIARLSQSCLAASLRLTVGRKAQMIKTAAAQQKDQARAHRAARNAWRCVTESSTRADAPWRR